MAKMNSNGSDSHLRVVDEAYFNRVVLKSPGSVSARSRAAEIAFMICRIIGCATWLPAIVIVVAAISGSLPAKIYAGLSSHDLNFVGRLFIPFSLIAGFSWLLRSSEEHAAADMASALAEFICVTAAALYFF